ncbi:MAG: hypothetical protein EOL97_14500 [Spirochaetia bacterium]|nr:hypothetical protein [Spirochaetia bacterium]
MGRTKIDINDEQLYKLKQQYRQCLSMEEIANLNGISNSKIIEFLQPFFNNGELQIRKGGRKKLDPNRPKKKYNYYIKKGGWGGQNKKFTAEQEQQIISDYWDKGLTATQLKEKWGINPQTRHNLVKKVVESGERTHKISGKPLKLYTIGDMQYSLPQLSQMYGIRQITLRGRLERGWDLDKALVKKDYRKKGSR